MTTELPVIVQDNSIITHLSMAGLLQGWCQGGIIIQQNSFSLSLCLWYVPEQICTTVFVTGWA